MIEFLYPIISAAAWRLGGIGKSKDDPGGSEKTGILKRITKGISFALFSLPLIYFFYDKTKDIFSTILFAAVVIPGTLVRRQIADSEDYPHRLPINLKNKQYLNFDWLIGWWKTRKKASINIYEGQDYKTVSYSLNKVVIGSYLYVPLSLLFLTPFYLIGSLANAAFGIIYRFCYDIFDYGQKKYSFGGHAAAEVAIGFYLGVVDILLFKLLTNHPLLVADILRGFYEKMGW